MATGLEVKPYIFKSQFRQDLENEYKSLSPEGQELKKKEIEGLIASGGIGADMYQDFLDTVKRHPTEIPERQSIDGQPPLIPSGLPDTVSPPSESATVTPDTTRLGLSPTVNGDTTQPRPLPQIADIGESTVIKNENNFVDAIDRGLPSIQPVYGQANKSPSADESSKKNPVEPYNDTKKEQRIKADKATKKVLGDTGVTDFVGGLTDFVGDMFDTGKKYATKAGEIGVGAALGLPYAIGQGVSDIANLPQQDLAPLLRGMQRALKPTPPRFGIPYSAGETFGTAASESLGGWLDESQKQQELALKTQKQKQLFDVQQSEIKKNLMQANAWESGRGLQSGTEMWHNETTDKYMTLPKGVQAPEGFVPTTGFQQVSGAKKAQEQGKTIPLVAQADIALKQAKIDALKKQGDKPKWKTPAGDPVFAGTSGIYTLNEGGENIPYKGQIDPIAGRPISRKFNEIKLAYPDLSDKEIHEKSLQEQRDMIRFGREETAKNQFSRLGYDTVTKSPVQVTARQMNDANKEDPGRILTLNKQTSDIVAKGLFLNEIDTGIKNVDTSINGMAKENPTGISNSLRVAMKTVMSKDTPGLMKEAVNTVLKGELVKDMTRSEQDYLISHARLAENAMALRGVLGIGNQSAVDIRNKIMDTLPDVTKASDWDYMRRQSSALKSVLDIARDNSILIRRKSNTSKPNITESKFKEILNSYKIDGKQGSSTQLLDELNSQGIYVAPSEDE